MLNSASVIERLISAPLAELKGRPIEGDERTYSYSRHEDLSEHLEILRREFIGLPEITFYHAVLVVLIRRKLSMTENVNRFHELWREEAEFLCDYLDSRWLISACDTIADHCPDRRERALAIAGSLFMNTIKLYETERWSTGKYGIKQDYKPVVTRVPLHDGLSSFVIGQGDMITNLHRRVRSLADCGGPAGLILNELLKRASLHDTVYRRFRSVHKNQATSW